MRPLPSPQPPNFDRVARLYRWAEYAALGTLLERTREQFLPQLSDRRQALVLGDGDGRFLARLLDRNPGLHAVAVDSSAAMLTLLHERCLRVTQDAAQRLQTLHTSALDLTLSPGIDLIVTHFFLDCFTQAEVDRLATTLAAAVPRGALWLLSDFDLPRTRWLRPLAALYIRALYFAFRLLTGLRVTKLPNPRAALTAAGFFRVARRQRLCGLLYTELWQRA